METLSDMRYFIMCEFSLRQAKKINNRHERYKDKRISVKLFFYDYYISFKCQHTFNVEFIRNIPQASTVC